MGAGVRKEGGKGKVSQRDVEGTRGDRRGALAVQRTMGDADPWGGEGGVRGAGQSRGNKIFAKNKKRGEEEIHGIIRKKEVNL